MCAHRLLAALCALSLCACGTTVGVASGASALREPAPTFYAELAQRLGADERGMRRYVLVVLKTGPRRMPEGEARQTMFAGHFANMQRLSEAGQLALAGPFMPNEEGWRGLFVFAVETVEEAQALTATDPVIIEGEMVAEYHPWYGSAALMALPDLHKRLQRPKAD